MEDILSDDFASDEEEPQRRQVTSLDITRALEEASNTPRKRVMMRRKVLELLKWTEEEAKKTS